MNTLVNHSFQEVFDKLIVDPLRARTLIASYTEGCSRFSLSLPDKLDWYLGKNTLDAYDVSGDYIKSHFDCLYASSSSTKFRQACIQDLLRRYPQKGLMLDVKPTLGYVGTFFPSVEVQLVQTPVASLEGCSNGEDYLQRIKSRNRTLVRKSLKQGYSHQMIPVSAMSVDELSTAVHWCDKYPVDESEYAKRQIVVANAECLQHEYELPRGLGMCCQVVKVRKDGATVAFAWFRQVGFNLVFTAFSSAPETSMVGTYVMFALVVEAIDRRMEFLDPQVYSRPLSLGDTEYAAYKKVITGDCCFNLMGYWKPVPTEGDEDGSN